MPNEINKMTMKGENEQTLVEALASVSHNHLGVSLDSVLRLIVVKKAARRLLAIDSRRHSSWND